MAANVDAATMKVSDLMTRKPITVSPDVTIRQVLALMQGASIRHIPVVDEKEGLMGMVSDRDLKFLHQIPGVFDEFSEEKIIAALDAPIGVALKSRFLVNKDVIVLRGEEKLGRAIDLFVGSGFGALPVLDADQCVVGILSVIDVLRWVGDEVLKSDEEKRNQ